MEGQTMQQELFTLDKFSTKIAEIKPENIVQAAERDLRYKEVNAKRRAWNSKMEMQGDLSMKERLVGYSFPARLVEKFETPKALLSEVYCERQKSKLIPKTKGEQNLWGDVDVLAKAVHLAK
jgi:hypothetical protein